MRVLAAAKHLTLNCSPSSSATACWSPTQPAGTFGNTGRGDFTGPDLRTFDLSFSKTARWAALGPQTRVEFRVEVFNVLNRTNFGIPELRAFAGQTDGEAQLATFGRINNTVTSARQTQLGLRITFLNQLHRRLGTQPNSAFTSALQENT